MIATSTRSPLSLRGHKTHSWVALLAPFVCPQIGGLYGRPCIYCQLIFNRKFTTHTESLLFPHHFMMPHILPLVTKVRSIIPCKALVSEALKYFRQTQPQPTSHTTVFAIKHFIGKQFFFTCRRLHLPPAGETMVNRWASTMARSGVKRVMSATACQR